jgi:hypothetical protein
MSLNTQFRAIAVPLVPGTPKAPPPGVSEYGVNLKYKLLRARQLTNNNLISLSHPTCILTTKINLSWRLPLSAFLNPSIQSNGSRLTSAHAIRCDSSPLSKNRDVKGNTELNMSDATVTTVVECLASGSTTDGELMQDAGIALLESLRIRNPRVGHMHVDAGWTLPVWPSARSR